jgi:hypothetical protein
MNTNNNLNPTNGIINIILKTHIVFYSIYMKYLSAECGHIEKRNLSQYTNKRLYCSISTVIMDFGCILNYGYNTYKIFVLMFANKDDRKNKRNIVV